MNKNQSLYKLFFFVLIFSCILQDLPTQEIFGTIARCPIVFLSPPIFFIIVLRERQMVLSTLPKYFFYYSGITIATALVMMLITVIFVSSGGFRVYDQVFPFKLARAAMYNVIFFVTAYNFSVLIKYVSLGFIYRILNFLLLFLVAYAFAEYFIAPYPIPFIHSSISVVEYHTRLTLTGPEPSYTTIMFGCLMLVLVALRIHLQKNGLVTLLYAAIIIAMLLLINSKGGIFFFTLAVVWSIRKMLSFKTIILGILVMIPLIYFIIYFVVPDLIVDIESFGSVSTRSTTWLAAFQSLYKYPIGEGYGTYLVYYPPLLLPMNQWISDVSGIPFLNHELADMVSSGQNLPAKAGIPNEIIYNGITALIFFGMVFRYYFSLNSQVVNKMVNLIFNFLGAFMFLEFLFNVSFETSYYYLLPFFVLIKITTQPLSSVANAYQK